MIPSLLGVLPKATKEILALFDPLLRHPSPVVEVDHALRPGGHGGDDETYLLACSWQKPYPTQEQERIDKHQRPAVSSYHLIRTLLLAWGGRNGGSRLRQRDYGRQAMDENSEQSLFKRISVVVEQIGASPNDTDDIRLQKTLSVGIALMIVPAGFVWGSIYLILGEPLTALIPLFYAVISLLSITIFAMTGLYRLYRSQQLLMILVLPFLMMATLGGFVNGSAVILWALLCPFGALLFTDRRQAVWWLLAYLGLLAASGVLELFDRAPNDLSATWINVFFVMNVSGVSIIAFVLLRYFSTQKDAALTLLNRERERSERLLLNVLPAEIAEILKDNDRIIADHFDSVSVLFADVVGSTSLTVELAPERMVKLLNEVFSYFDSLVEKYGVEKIRTIGDNYMVASGVPRPRSDHGAALANMALEMNAYICDRPAGGGTPLQFRIGMNTGPVVAGVIGQKKFHYDIWGDAVNTASRMESHGIPGKIQITREMYELIKDEFVCVRRGIVDVRGKGEMETWYLEGPRISALSR